VGTSCFSTPVLLLLPGVVGVILLHMLWGHLVHSVWWYIVNEPASLWWLSATRCVSLLALHRQAVWDSCVASPATVPAYTHERCRLT